MVATQNWDTVSDSSSQLPFLIPLFCLLAIHGIFGVVHHDRLLQGCSEFDFAENKLTIFLKSLHWANLL